MTVRLDPELRRRLREEPGAQVRLIVGVSGNLEDLAEELAQAGLVVHRRLSLLNAVAVGATGEQALALAQEPWVEWIEEDREVRALGPRRP